jgi:hypothetical protein
MTKQNSELTVLSADQAALVDHVKTYHKGVSISYEHQIQYAFMAGLTLTALKDSCPHGNAKDANGLGFTTLREQFLPELSHSAASRYMLFTKLVKEDNATVGIIRQSNLLLENGDLPPKEKAAILAAVYEAADGKSWTAFYRDLNLVREKQSASHHPIKPLSPADKIAAENADADAHIDTALYELAFLLMDLESKTGKLALRVHPHRWQDLLSATIRLNNLVRPLTKRKLSPADKKAEISDQARAALKSAASKRWETLKAVENIPADES